MPLVRHLWRHRRNSRTIHQKESPMMNRYAICIACALLSLAVLGCRAFIAQAHVRVSREAPETSIDCRAQDCRQMVLHLTFPVDSADILPAHYAQLDML